MPSSPRSSQADPTFELLLEFLRDARGFDFTGYKRASLMRRVRSRMGRLGIDDFEEYRSHLEQHTREFAELFDTILINVTEFFRDPEAWEALAREVSARFASEIPQDRAIRVWSAGCATGQESYTLVMVLAEALGIERFKRLVKIYATDVDEDALGRARSAQYTSAEVESVSARLRKRYFERAGERWTFRQDLRRLLIFGRHDLTRDAPISHIDILVCRNLLMYFTAETQSRVLSRFHFALEDDGLLFLGKAETMRAQGHLFSAADLKSRIFTMIPKSNARDQQLMLARTQVAAGEVTPQTAHQLRLRSAALEAVPVATVTLDTDGALVLANQAARNLFGLYDSDTGRRLQDLSLSYHPLELRSRIEAVRAERRMIHVRNVEWPSPDGSLRNFDVDLVPLIDESREIIGVSISFADVTHFHRLQAELVETNQERANAYEQLQSTYEELETTNEELQSTNEELETTNEELQSTNEELETMNEELQSTNLELETINVELSVRTAELDELSAYMSSILRSVRMGVIVIDRNMDIRLWNQQAEDLWGLRADEVIGKGFQTLDIGLPVEKLKAPIRACLYEGVEYHETVLESVDRRRRPVRCRVTCAPLMTTSDDVGGAVLLIEEWNERPDGGGPDGPPRISRDGEELAPSG